MRLKNKFHVIKNNSVQKIVNIVWKHYCIYTITRISRFTGFIGAMRTLNCSSYIESYTVTSEVAVSFYPDVVAQIWLDPSGGLWGCWATFITNFFQYNDSFMPFLASEVCFWPLVAFMRSEVKNNYAHFNLN